MAGEIIQSFIFLLHRCAQPVGRRHVGTQHGHHHQNRSQQCDDLDDTDVGYLCNPGHFHTAVLKYQDQQPGANRHGNPEKCPTGIHQSGRQDGYRQHENHRWGHDTPQDKTGPEQHAAQHKQEQVHTQYSPAEPEKQGGDRRGDPQYDPQQQAAPLPPGLGQGQQKIEHRYQRKNIQREAEQHLQEQPVSMILAGLANRVVTRRQSGTQAIGRSHPRVEQAQILDRM